MGSVSVIIPTFNRDEILGETLDSLTAQTYPHWEALIVDDHSTDRSLEIANQYAARDSRFRTFRRVHARKGANLCRNEGLAAANGKYIIFLDSDDLLSPTCLEQRVADMEKSPDCEFGVYLTELFTNFAGDRKLLNSVHTEGNDLYRFLSMDSAWFTTGPIWKKEALERLGGYDENLLSFQDWSMHVRALIAGFRYFKKPVRDNYHRYQYSNSTITSISWMLPEHLLSQEAMFEQTIETMCGAGLCNDEVRLRLVGIYWYQARRWQKISDYANARRIWRRAFDQGFSSRLHYLEGCLIFYLYNFRGGGFLARLMQRSWPIQYHRHTPTPTAGIFAQGDASALIAKEEIDEVAPDQETSANVSVAKPSRN